MKSIPVFLTIFLGLLGSLAMAQPYSIVIKGGRLIDPKNNIDAVMDIAITDGKVAQIAKTDRKSVV